MSMDIKQTFREKLFECDKHVERIKTAKAQLKVLFPLTNESYENVNEVQASFIDQLVFRFSKLQDTIGEKIFPSILILAQEDIKRKTFVDILNRLEELELIDKTHWLLLRETRNEIAHEYSENVSEVVASLNDVYTKSNDTIEVYLRVKKYCIEKLLI